MVSLGGLGRLGQGLNLGNAPAIEKEVEAGVAAAANAATGGKFGAVKTAMSAAAPIAGSIAQGAGLRVGWTLGGILNFLLNAAKNMVPEFGTDAGFFGTYVWLIVIVYWMSWIAGFTPSAVLRSHAIIALVGFIISVFVDGISFQAFRRYGVVFSVLMIIDYMLLTGTIQWTLVLIATLLLAFREGNPVQDAGRVLLVMGVAGIGRYAYLKFFGLLLQSFAKLSLPLSFDSFLLFGAILANRTITFPFFWYSVFGLNKKTRVARSLAWFVMFLLIFANWPLIAPEVNKVRSQYASGASAEQKAVIPNLFKSAVVGGRSLGASLGALMTAKTAYAYEKAQETFGFGEPKEEPKLGLTLVPDITMLKKYDLDFKAPEPSFIMRITSPFPADAKKPYIEVTNIQCSDKQNMKFTATTSRGVTPTEVKNEKTNAHGPVAVFYNGPDGGTQVKCAAAGWESGDYTIGAEVDYKVDATAFLTTAFIRSDQDEALRLQGIDPAVVNKIQHADARYDNVPVTLTWGPPDLTKAPASIDISPGNKNPANLLITVYVAKNTGWENSEIKSVKDLVLTLPPGLSLVEGDSCDFKLKDVNLAGSNTNLIYAVKDARIVKTSKNEETGEETKAARFIGDAIRFDCGLKVDQAALSGADWAPARFDVSGSFIFTTKLDSISFTVTGGDKAATAQGSSQTAAQPTPQQLQDKCTATGGTWKAAANPPICDCGAGKKWDATKGCIASSSPASTPQPSGAQA